MSQSEDGAKAGARRAFLKNVAVAGAATSLSGVVGETFAQAGTRAGLNSIMMGQTNMQKLVMAGNAKIDGNSQKLGEFVSWLDNFDFWFNIVTP